MCGVSDTLPPFSAAGVSISLGISSSLLAMTKERKIQRRTSWTKAKSDRTTSVSFVVKLFNDYFLMKFIAVEIAIRHGATP